MSCTPPKPASPGQLVFLCRVVSIPKSLVMPLNSSLAACGVDTNNPMSIKLHRESPSLGASFIGGYESDVAAALGQGFVDHREDIVLIKGISVHGVCPHHLVPFRGLAHVAYIPGGVLHGFGGSHAW